MSSANLELNLFSICAVRTVDSVSASRALQVAKIVPGGSVPHVEVVIVFRLVDVASGGASRQGCRIGDSALQIKG